MKQIVRPMQIYVLSDLSIIVYPCLSNVAGTIYNRGVGIERAT